MERRLRAVLWVVCVSILVGTAAELALVQHWADPAQRIPFLLSLVGLLSIGAAWVRPSPKTLRLCRWVMGSLVAGGAFGMWEHFDHNYAFAAEIEPNAGSTTWLIEALVGANPLLAPGIFTVAALAGLGAAWNHPSGGTASNGN